MYYDAKKIELEGENELERREHKIHNMNDTLWEFFGPWEKYQIEIIIIVFLSH